MIEGVACDRIMSHLTSMSKRLKKLDGDRAPFRIRFCKRRMPFASIFFFFFFFFFFFCSAMQMQEKISLGNIRGVWCREMPLTDIKEKLLKSERFDKRVWVYQFVKNSSEIQKLHAKGDSKLSDLLGPYLESLKKGLVFS